MTVVRRPNPRIPGVLLALFALLTALSGCTVAIGGTHYVPANSTADPFSSVRAKAEKYYQAGLVDAQKGDWSKALDEFRQASMWDHDGRQDIADALSRAQAQVDWQSYRQAGPIATFAAPSATVTPQDTAPQATQVADSPSATMKHFESQIFPYSVYIPRDWATKQEGSDQEPADTFVGTSGANSRALVMVSVEPAGFSTSLDQLYLATKDALEAQGVKNIEIYSRRQVDGQPAYVLSYIDSAESVTLSVRHAIFVTPGRAWHVVLFASPSITAALDQTFIAMLDSFKFNATAFPVQ